MGALQSSPTFPFFRFKLTPSLAEIEAEDSWARPTESAPKMKVDMLRVSVVGAGSISREFALHHFNAANFTEVVSIVDLNLERAKALATDVGSVLAGAHLDTGTTAYAAGVQGGARGTPVAHSAALGEGIDGCDVVYIGTTPGSHKTLALEALAAGKHVLLEKPLAATAEDADAIMAAAAEAADRGLFVGLDIGMRWNPALHELRRLAVTEQALGPLTAGRLTMHYAQWPRKWQVQPWVAERAQGGPLREVGTHFFFGILQCFGPRSVARVRANVDFPADDPAAAETTASGTLELRSGLRIDLDMRTDVAGSDRYELEIVGEQGALQLENFAQLRRTAPVREWLVEEGSYGRAESVTTLVDAVKSRPTAGPGMVTARDGRDAQTVLDPVLGSGGEWVELEYFC